MYSVRGVLWYGTMAFMVAATVALPGPPAWAMDALTPEETRTVVGGYDPLGECGKKPKTDLCDPERGETGCYLSSNGYWQTEFPNFITKWCQEGQTTDGCADQNPDDGMECCRRIFQFPDAQSCNSGSGGTVKYDECNHLKKVGFACTET